MQKQKHRILILGASGYDGNAIYRELCTYFETYGTYYCAHELYDNNKAFYCYDIAIDTIEKIVQKIKPTLLYLPFAEILKHNTTRINRFVNILAVTQGVDFYIYLL